MERMVGSDRSTEQEDNTAVAMVEPLLSSSQSVVGATSRKLHVFFFYPSSRFRPRFETKIDRKERKEATRKKYLPAHGRWKYLPALDACIYSIVSLSLALSLSL